MLGPGQHAAYPLSARDARVLAPSIMLYTQVRDEVPFIATAPPPFLPDDRATAGPFRCLAPFHCRPAGQGAAGQSSNLPRRGCAAA